MRPASHMPAEAMITIGPFRWLSRRESSQLPQILDVLRAEVERVLVHQAAGLRRVGVGMIAVDLGQARGQRAVDVDRDRAHLVHGEELLKAVDHALGAPQAEGRDDDLALETGRPGDDGVQLLHQAVVGIELAVAVGAFGNQDIDVLDRAWDRAGDAYCGGPGRR